MTAPTGGWCLYVVQGVPRSHCAPSRLLLCLARSRSYAVCGAAPCAIPQTGQTAAHSHNSDSMQPRTPFLSLTAPSQDDSHSPNGRQPALRRAKLVAHNNYSRAFGRLGPYGECGSERKAHPTLYCPRRAGLWSLAPIGTEHCGAMRHSPGFTLSHGNPGSLYPVRLSRR